MGLHLVVMAITLNGSALATPAQVTRPSITVTECPSGALIDLGGAAGAAIGAVGAAGTTVITGGTTAPSIPVAAGVGGLTGCATGIANRLLSAF